MANRIELLVPGRRVKTATAVEDVQSIPEQWNRRAECGNPSCSRGWLAVLKDRRRPVFEGKWGCSAKCVRSIVDSAIRREAGEDGAAEEDGGHHHRVPLGLVMLAQGWITQAQLRTALDAQKSAGSGRIGQWLTTECGLNKDLITRGISMQWGCPALTMEGFDAQAMALAVPKILVEALGLVPLRVAGGRVLYLAFADRLDAAAAFAIERMSGLKVQSGLVDAEEWSAARDKLRRCDFVDATFEQLADSKSLERRMASDMVSIQPRASRLVRVHQFYWLRMWLETGSMSRPNGGVPTSREDVVDRIYSVAMQQ
jgi:hypothetical protein